MMSTVKWDLKEIMSQHSPYIDALVMVCIIDSPLERGNDDVHHAFSLGWFLS